MTHGRRANVISVVGKVSCLLAAAAFLLVGCASTGSGSGDDDDSSRRSDVITRAEMVDADVSTLYEVVDRLRPQWLNVRQRSFSRETEILVVQNNTVIGDVEMLRQMGLSGVTELRYLDGDTAAATLVGARAGFVEGAIVIERRIGS